MLTVLKKIGCIFAIAILYHCQELHSSSALQSIKDDTTETWAGTGAKDATFTAVSMSMLGWGVGLAGGIAILASAIHQSSSSHESSSCSH